MVELDAIVKQYGATVAVDHVSLAVQAGELLTLLGPSGCGKTTTLRCIGGFVRPDSGCIRIGGEDVTRLPPYLRNIGMVFQSYALFPHLSVFENVAFGLRIRHTPRAQVEGRVRRILDSVRLADLAQRLPKQLSGGQQQRVALARALVYEPRVLLLDEPLSNLDAKLRVDMRLEIRALQRQLGLTAIYVTHDQEEALSISDRVAVMRDGRIEQLATPSELYHRPQTPFIANFVGVSNLFPAEAHGAELKVGRAFTLRMASPSVGPPGSAVWVVARPETLTLLPIEQASGNSVVGKVSTATFLGAILRLRVEVDEHMSVLVDLQNPGINARYGEGDHVAVVFDPERLVVLPRRAEA